MGNKPLAENSVFTKWSTMLPECGIKMLLASGIQAVVGSLMVISVPSSYLPK